jgi:RNA methyltransferase, RsmE family
MRRFYAVPENFQDEKVTLGADETKHLRDVLRLREGEKVRVFNGLGREFLCEIRAISKKETVLEINEEIKPSAPESDLDLTLAVALLKGEKFELVLQKAVELGVSKFVPLVTKRSEVKIKDAEKKLERWRKIILEASKQSGRAKLMRIQVPVEFDFFVRDSSSERADDESFVLFSERGGDGFSSIEAAKKITAVTGAEGGWEDSEINLAQVSGFRIVTFGGRIMRAETAAIAVTAVLQNRFGDLV